MALAAGVDELAHMPCDRADPEAMGEAASQGLRIVGTLHILGGCPAKLANARAFVAAGGTLLYGSDYPNPGIPPGIDLAELRLLRQAGLSPEQTIAAATSAAGKALGEAPLGSLVAGAPADLFAVRGNPLADLGRARAPILAHRRRQAGLLTRSPATATSRKRSCRRPGRPDRGRSRESRRPCSSGVARRAARRRRRSPRRARAASSPPRGPPPRHPP